MRGRRRNGRLVGDGYRFSTVKIVEDGLAYEAGAGLPRTGDQIVGDLVPVGNIGGGWMRAPESDRQMVAGNGIGQRRRICRVRIGVECVFEDVAEPVGVGLRR